ncbi:MAG: NAD-dependent epimerase/dehydratase family protein [Limnochordaceae bacterium]|nr:NAD-dependent epimerase/dehydratase family protein [Limnochordaceae bacterium]
MGRPGRVIVTGGAGFIGSHVVERLEADGWRVGVVDDLSTGRAANVPASCELIRADVRSPEAGRFIETFGAEAVAHLAAQVSVAASVRDPGHDLSVNVLGTVAVVQACARGGVRRVVLASSAAVYGMPACLPVDERHPLLPVSPYGASKLAAEHYLRVMAQQAGIGWVALRYANVYGPRQSADGEAGVVARWMALLEAGRPLVVHGDGQQSRDFVFVDDVAEATARALTAETACNCALNIGTGLASRVLDLADALWSAAGKEGPPPLTFAPPRPGDIRHSRLDARKAERLLGWRARISLEQGLRQMVARRQAARAAGEGD